MSIVRSLSAAVALVLAATTTVVRAGDVTPPSLNDVLQLKAPAVDAVAVMRANMLTSAGRTVGFRAGLANQGIEYKHMLDSRASVLDKMYQFQTLLGPGGVQPPVIVEARDSESINNDQMRTATRIYKIIRPEKLVSVPPTWRDYLYTGLILNGDIALPEGDARPKNNAEMAVWQEAVREGWKQGQKEATAIFEANLNRLTRDFNGMLRYSILLKQHIITPTQVAESHRAVTGDTIEIKLDDRLRRITQKAQLQTDPSKWQLKGVKGTVSKGEVAKP
jgi:defect-in-organelle-trafficking protein DotC